MDCYTLVILAGMAMLASGWSFPFYPVYYRRLPQIRVTRFAPLPHPHRIPIRVQPLIRQQAKPKPERPKHDYNYYDEDDHNHKNDHNHKDDHNHKNDLNHKNDYNHQIDNKGNGAVIGPVHTFVKTDKNANYKWGVRHHVANKRAP